MAAICGNQRLFRQKKVYVPHTPCTAGERGARCRPGAGGREEWRRGRPPLRVFSEGGRHGKKPPHRSRRSRMPTPAAAISSAVCIGRKEKRSPTAMKKRMSILPPCRRFQGCALAGRAVSARHIRNVAPCLGRRRFFLRHLPEESACTEQARGNVRREKARHEQRGAGGRLCACFQRGAGMAGSPGRSGGPGAWAKRRSHAEGTGTRNKRPADVPAGQQRNGSEHRLPDAPGAEAPLTHTTKPASSQRRRGFFCSLRGGADREHPCGLKMEVIVPSSLSQPRPAVNTPVG